MAAVHHGDMTTSRSTNLPRDERDRLLGTLADRFSSHMDRHRGIDWSTVRKRLESRNAALWSLDAMERSGGEPDVVGVDAASGAVIFVDCSAQSPKGRRSACYDREALNARREHKPATSAMDMAREMGAAVLTVRQYRYLQELGEFDTSTSSWVRTPSRIRRLGGALFCDRRYDTVFTYHNGAESYYAARGFRCLLRV